MKKLMRIVFGAILALGLGVTTASAAGAITADEQAILNELNAGVTAGGDTFFFNATQISDAEYYLKVNDYPASATTVVVGHIQAARKLVVDNSTGIKATSLSNLIAQLPQNIQTQIWDHIMAAATALDLSIDQGGNVINKKDGKTVITNGAPIVKATGANYTTSLVAFASLMIAALGAVVVGKKYANA